ncbi:MAG: FadR/GntR family transcriptional regulator [Bryobacteraceae bacterium]
MTALPIPIVKPDLTPKLVASFKDMIQRGELVPGCRLPSERELSARFGVSRPSLRQALKVLDIMGPRDNPWVG